MKDRIELNSEAIRLRREFGEDLLSPIDVFSMIDNLDRVTVVLYPMSDRISGMCIRTGIDNLIAINSTSSYGRRRFTAAHELYHLYIQESFKSVICANDFYGGKDDEERNADAFASYFLAPYDALKLYIRDKLKKTHFPLTIDDVVRIEQHFGMSRQATLYRLVAEKNITQEFADTLKTNVIRSARKLGFDDKLYIPLPSDKQYLTIGSYVELAENLKEKEIISNGKYEGYLLDAYRSDIVYNMNADGEERYD